MVKDMARAAGIFFFGIILFMAGIALMGFLFRLILDWQYYPYLR